MRRFIVGLCFSLCVVLGSYHFVLATPVQTTINVRVEPASAYSASGTDYSFLFNHDFSFIFNYEEEGDFWTGGPASSIDFIPSAYPHGTPLDQSEFEWSTEFDLPEIDGGYLQEGQESSSLYTRTSMEGGYWYRWEIVDPTVGMVVFFSDEERLRGWWSGSPGFESSYDIIEFSYAPMTISTHLKTVPVPEPDSLILFVTGLGIFVGISFVKEYNILNVHVKSA